MHSSTGSEEIVQQLQRLGFREADARRALAAARPAISDAAASGVANSAHSGIARQRAVSAALDWLCMNLPEEALPAKYAAGG